MYVMLVYACMYVFIMYVYICMYACVCLCMCLYICIVRARVCVIKYFETVSSVINILLPYLNKSFRSTALKFTSGSRRKSVKQRA